MTTSTAGANAVPTFRRELHPSPVSVSRRDEIHAAPGFGRYFTDHMVLIDYDEGQGWHDPAVVPYGPITLDPSAAISGRPAGAGNELAGRPARERSARCGYPAPGGRSAPSCCTPNWRTKGQK